MHFLHLPLEIRLLVFNHLFSSNSFTPGTFHPRPSVPIAILLTCHQLHTEVQPLLPSVLPFHFRGTTHLLDHLTTFHPATLSRLRYLDLTAHAFPVLPFHGAETFTTHVFAAVLPILKGLQLDILTLRDGFHSSSDSQKHGADGDKEWVDVATYCEVQNLLRSRGWKELRYYSPTPSFLSWPSYEGHIRRSQPWGWDRTMKERDGEGSGAGVELFLVRPEPGSWPSASKRRDGRSLVQDRANARWMSFDSPTGPATSRERFSQARMHDNEVVGEDAVLRSTFEIRNTAVLVVVRRGRNADYVEDGELLENDIEDLLRRMTWRQLKMSGLYLGDRSEWAESAGGSGDSQET